MKLSIPFLLHNDDITDIADELMILYDNNSKVENLQSFGEKYKDKRINIYFNIENDFNIVDIIEKSNLDNFVIVTDYFVKPETLKLFIDKEWDYYILVPAKNFYDISFYSKMGVSDIFIADDLWHNLPKVKEKCGDIKIRMNGDRSGLYGKWFSKEHEEYYISFIPRPDDYELLDNYINIIQFNSNEISKLKIYSKVWFKTHKWRGRINELYSHPESELDLYNISIPKDYTESKITCGARCMTGSPCRKCKHTYQMAEAALEKGVELKFNDV